MTQLGMFGYKLFYTSGAYKNKMLYFIHDSMPAVRRNRKRVAKRKPYSRRSTKRRGAPARRALSRSQRGQLYGSKTGAVSYVSRKRKPTRMGRYVRNQIFKTASAANYYYANGSTRITGTAGQQAFSAVSYLGGTGDTDAIGAAINANCTRYTIDSARQEMWFTNQGAANLFVKLYECYARKDIPVAEGSVNTLFGQGFTDEGQGSAGNKLGVTPFQNNKFCSFFKIQKVHDRMLHAGESFNMVLNAPRNKMINRESMRAADQSALKGYTKFFFIMCHSAPLNDLTTKTIVSAGTVALDVVFVNKYTYRWVNDYDNSLSISNNLSTTLTEYIMDYATGSGQADSVA